MKREQNIQENDSSQQQENDTKKHKKIAPRNDSGTAETNSGSSMSEGNLSNSRYGREKTRSLHDKQSITGSDTDGQPG
ncbi:MAG: hypothetical protein EOO04_38495 [Chitinophagaceae bacterium]|nr:MAG: hypothetical protein EOO04_38495 [Chitinophagaceae bacterium]